MRFKQLCAQIQQEGSAIRAGGAEVSHTTNAAARGGCQPATPEQRLTLMCWVSTPVHRERAPSISRPRYKMMGPVESNDPLSKRVGGAARFHGHAWGSGSGWDQSSPLTLLKSNNYCVHVTFSIHSEIHFSVQQLLGKIDFLRRCTKCCFFFYVVFNA